LEGGGGGEKLRDRLGGGEADRCRAAPLPLLLLAWLGPLLLTAAPCSSRSRWIRSLRCFMRSTSVASCWTLASCRRCGVVLSDSALSACRSSSCSCLIVSLRVESRSPPEEDEEEEEVAAGM